MRKSTPFLCLFIVALGCGSGKDIDLTGSSSSGAGASGSSTSSSTSSSSSNGGMETGGAGGMGSGGMGTGGIGTGGMGAGGMGAGGSGPVACPLYGQGKSGGNVSTGQLAEASGIVESRKTKGVLWIHNDSGDSPRIFAVGTSGNDFGEYSFQGANATDWEDIAIGPGPVNGETYLYVGDMGDNAMARSNIKIYRVVEPVVDTAAGPKTVMLNGVETFTLVYDDGPHNAETLLVDPQNGDVYIVTKESGGNSQIFRAAAPLSNANTITMTEVGKLAFGPAPLSGDPLTTGGDISAQGDLIIVRTYLGAFIWRRSSGMTITEAFAGEPCVVSVKSEPQGEGIGFAVDGSGYFTISEGANEPIYFYAKQ